MASFQSLLAQRTWAAAKLPLEVAAEVTRITPPDIRHDLLDAEKRMANEVVGSVEALRAIRSLIQPRALKTGG
jgi:alpha-beta hydrolase superfamily lysophospholipase